MAVRDRPAEPLAKTYFCLTAAFIVSVIASIVGIVALASLFAYGLLPGADDSPSHRGLTQAHPTIVLLTIVAVGVAVVTGIALAVIDRITDR